MKPGGSEEASPTEQPELESELVHGGDHSFIIRIWIEETKEEAGHTAWRGHITHIPGGERQYVQDFNSIQTFIARYLKEMGVSLQFPSRLGSLRERLIRQVKAHRADSGE